MSARNSRDTTHVVVVNQHGDNRGDEAAMRAMVRGIGDRIESPRFTIVHQFADPASEVALAHPTTYLGMRFGVFEYARLFAFAALAAVGIRVPRIAGRRGRQIVAAIASADLVVSAPGGPYFGDLYAGHEIAHWLYVWLAHRARRPLALYAPSCGPFEHRLLNLVRRRGFRWFDSVTVREARSGALLTGLTDMRVTVTADAALQDVVAPSDRSKYADDDEWLLVVAARDPGSRRRDRHDASVLAAIDRMCHRVPTAVIFLPQLHGRRRDVPYLSQLAQQVTRAKRVLVAPETDDCEAQRALIATADCVIAGRYHPAVFAIASATPVLVIPYEHKAEGVAEAAGIGAWSTWVDDLEPSRLADQLVALMQDAAHVRTTLERAAARLREQSSQSSVLAVALIDAGGRTTNVRGG